MASPTDPSSAAAGPNGGDAPRRAERAEAGHAGDLAGGGGGEQGPRARRGLGALGRSVLLAVALVVAFLGGLVAVVALTGDDGVVTGADPAGSGSAGSTAADGGEVPATLPPATLAGFGGGDPVRVAEYRGEPLLVNFWATWCAPCVDEMPALQQVHAELGDRVTFLGVDVRDAPDNAEAFVEELDISYDLAVDAEGDYYREVGARGMPTTLLVDAQGRIVERHTGPLTAGQLRELLAEELDVQA